MLHLYLLHSFYSIRVLFKFPINDVGQFLFKQLWKTSVDISIGPLIGLIFAGFIQFFCADSHGTVHFFEKKYLLIFNKLNTYSNQTK